MIHETMPDPSCWGNGLLGLTMSCNNTFIAQKVVLMPRENSSHLMASEVTVM